MNPNNIIEEEINRIRLEIYEETKNMNPKQLTEYYKKSTEDTIEKYGFKVVASARENTLAQGGK